MVREVAVSAVRIELAYRVRTWQVIVALVLIVTGLVGSIVLGVYLYGGGDLGINGGVGALLRGKAGAMIAWIFAGFAAMAA